MTALDAYLARERETLRASTPRPWRIYAGYPDMVGADAGTVGKTSTTDDAKAIVSAVNDREALLDAVELLAEAQRHPDWMIYKNGALRQRIDAVLSRLTADSEGVTHV